MSTNKSRTILFLLPLLIIFAFVTAFSLRAPELDARAIEEEEDFVVLAGEGTELNPYQVTDRNEFLVMLNGINATPDTVYSRVPYYANFNQSYFMLLTDIDLSLLASDEVIAPIGTVERPFTGGLFGSGFIIYNLHLDATNNQVPSSDGYDSYVGLFGYVGDGARINSVGVSGASIDYPSTGKYVGGIAGYNAGTIDNCFFDGEVNGYQYVGGIAGANEGTISDCFANGNVTANNPVAYLGGIAGSSVNGAIKTSYTLATVKATGTGATNVGGVTGELVGNTLSYSNSYFNKSVNEGLYAIGGDAENSAYDVDNAGLKIKGLINVEFNSMDIISLFGSAANNSTSQDEGWIRKFTVNDHTEYVAPIHKRFYMHSDAEAVRNVATIRMFGIDKASEEEWGSELNPYLISDAKQMINLQQAVNVYSQTYLGKYFKLIKDIRYTSSVSPIGIYNGDERDVAFQATFDGDNHVIYDLQINKTETKTSHLGLFGYLGDSGTVKNLTLDKSCTVYGDQYIGALVGFNNDGDVINIESAATVQSTYYSGGIVGESNLGVYANILSKANLVSSNISATTLYGVIGSITNTPTAVDNVWYYAEIGVTKFSGTNDLGNVIYVDKTDGTLTVTKDANGNITFVGNPKSGLDVEYRNGDELILQEGTTYVQEATTAPLGIDKAKVYARFVRALTASTDQPVSSTVTVKGNENSTYYRGQTFSVEIKIVTGVYVRNVKGVDINGTEVSLENIDYMYDSIGSAVIFSATMKVALVEIVVDIEAITWSEDVFPTTYVYNGEPVSFPVDQLQPPVGYKIEVAYTGEVAPKDANASDSENYSLTIYYKHVATDVTMGLKRADYHINKLKLNLVSNAYGYLSTSKEWDNSILPVNCPSVNQDVMANKIPSDDLVLSAKMSFNTTSITTGTATITYEFALSGKSAHNYIVPDDYVYANGSIVKRQVTISFNSYQSYFAGLGKNPSYSHVAIDYSGVLNIKPIAPIYSFTHTEEGKEMGSVGKYKLKVSLPETGADDCASKYYNVSFAGAKLDVEDSRYYVDFIVLPREVNAIYLIDGVETLETIYNASNQAISAHFYDINGTKQALSTSITEVKNADTYAVGIVNFTDANYSFTNGTVSIIVDKATQTITTPEDQAVVFGANENKYTATATASSGAEAGTITYALSDACAGMGEFDVDVLTIFKAGTITIEVEVADSANYYGASASYELVVSKGSIAVYVNDLTVNYSEDIVFTFGNQEGIDVQGITGVKVYVDGELFDENKNYVVQEYSLTIDVDEAVSYGYEVSVANVDAKLTVKPLDITITAKAVESVYGEPKKALEYAVSVDIPDELQGELECNITGVKEGGYEILQGTLTNENNPNYNVVSYLSAIYTVTPAKLTVVAKDLTKEYGAEDPKAEWTVKGLITGDTEQSVGLSVTLTRIPGEDTFYAGDSVTSRSYAYFASHVSVASANYTVTFDTENSGALTIVQGTPTVSNVQAISITAGTSLNDYGAPTATFTGNIYDVENMGWSSQELLGSISWKKNATPDFTDSSSLDYVAVFTPENRNYKAVEFNVTVSVIPVELTVNFTGAKSIVYDGKEHKDMTYTLVGLISGVPAGETVIYTGDTKNANSFEVSVSISNHNYVLKGTTKTTVTITPAKLTITAQAITAMEGDEITVVYDYDGFVVGDNDTKLTSAPNAIIPAEPGNYSVKPYGAKSDNYAIEYVAFSVKILKKTLTTEDESVTIEGSFDADVTVEVAESTDNSKIEELYANIKDGYSALETKEIDKVYTISYALGEEATTISGKTYLTMAIPEEYEDLTQIAFCAYTVHGEVIYVQDVTFNDGYVTINVTDCQAIAIVVEAEQSNPMILYIAIAAVVVVVIVIIIIARKVKKNREKRFIKYDEE